MPLRFLCDEHLRGRLWRAITRHNQSGGLEIDLLAVGDPSDLQLGSSDPGVLEWAERNDRILLTRDVTTMPTHLDEHLAAGRHSPGVIVLRSGFTLTEIVAFLELIAHAGEPADYTDRITFVP